MFLWRSPGCLRACRTGVMRLLVLELANGAKYACFGGGFIVQYRSVKYGFFESSERPGDNFVGGKYQMTRRVIYGTALVAVLCGCLCVGAAPEPAIIPEPGDWTLDVKFEQPQFVMMSVGGARQRFWYMILTVTNRTREDVGFYPQCELMTDKFEIIPAGRGVPAAVFQTLKRRYQGKYPFLEPLEKAGNRMLQGEDNTKDIALMWSDFGGRAESMKIFITGLSNETAVIDNPIVKDANGEPVKEYLRKTLELDYRLGGEPALRSDIKLTFTGKRWVMR